MAHRCWWYSKRARFWQWDMSAEHSFLILDESPRRFLSHKFNTYWFTHCKKCFFYSLIWHFVSNTIALCLKMQHLLRWWGLLICWHLSLDLLKVFDLAKARLGISYCLCFSGENYSQYTCKILYVVRHCQILGYNNLLCIKCFSVLGGRDTQCHEQDCLYRTSVLPVWKEDHICSGDKTLGVLPRTQVGENVFVFVFFLCKAI